MTVSWTSRNNVREYIKLTQYMKTVTVSFSCYSHGLDAGYGYGYGYGYGLDWTGSKKITLDWTGG